MHKKALLASSVLTTMALPAVASAELTANVGWVSDYIFRGYFQEDSSAYGGVDYAADSGFYAGVWGADVEYGLEIDLYAGYSGEFGEAGGYTVGFTGYFYTEDDPGEPSVFDDTYTEINLGISYGIFSIDHAIGEWDGFGTSSDYTFTTVAISPETGPYYSYNTFGDDSSGDYFEIGYGWSSMDLDFSVAFLYDLNAGDPDSVFLDEDFTGFDDTAFTFGVSKTFALDD
ncbi:MAG TPA: TorF family putative porin [Gammaproteobacteria bacterium]|jgi:uncharacterized protein (TIGR02001 family)